jgi:hypothetical protein
VPGKRTQNSRNHIPKKVIIIKVSRLCRHPEVILTLSVEHPQKQMMLIIFSFLFFTVVGGAVVGIICLIEKANTRVRGEKKK